jgi:multiple sugar transport system substrate-binding protein
MTVSSRRFDPTWRSITERRPSRRDFLRLVTAGAVGVAAGSPLLACSPGGGGSGAGLSLQEGELKYLSEDTSDIEVAWYRRVTEAFEAQYTRVNGEHLGTGEDFYQKLQTLFAARTPPDLIPRTSQARALTLWTEGVLQPVGDIVDRIGRDKFTQAGLDAFIDNGDVYGIPSQGTSTVFWYRTDLAEQAGLSGPTTWEELLAFAKALTVDTDGDGRIDQWGTSVPFGRNSMTNQWFFCLLRQNGGNIVDPDLNVVFDSPKTVEALEFMRELVQYSPPGGGNFSFAEMVSNFVTGKSASTYYMGRIVQTVEDTAPDLSGKFEATMFPRAAGADPFWYGALSAAVVPADVERRDLAEAWLVDFQFKSFYLDWLNLLPGHNLPLMKGFDTLPEYTNYPARAKYPAIMETLQRSLEEGNDFVKESPDHKLNPMGGELASGFILADMIQSVLIQNEDSASAVKRAAGQISEVMERGMR